MNITAVKTVARDLGIKPGKMNKEELIRSIQLTEENPQCFNTSTSQQCGEAECLWRGDCH